MADWRLARSLEQLRAEILQVAPGTTVWTIGDEAHQAGWSDHNPNGQGVVCAIDVLDDAGLDLGDLAETVRTGGHPAFKYVIWQDRVSYGGGWQSYRGTYHSHVHVSVGDGPDGRSTGPYDDTSPWGIAAHEGGIIMLPQRGDEGDHVETIQYMLAALGYDIGEDDDGDPLTDGIYGPATEEAVSQFRVDNSTSYSSGERVTPWTYYRLMRKVGSLDGGERGPQGPPGELPDEVRIAGGTLRIEG